MEVKVALSHNHAEISQKVVNKLISEICCVAAIISPSQQIYSRCWEDAISVWRTGTDFVCADVFLLEILNWYLKGSDNVFGESQYSMDCTFKTKFQVDMDQTNILIFYCITFSLYSEHNNYIA